MLRILHAADLHLSISEREYGLGVFAELIETARRERVDFLLFCGDLFDTFPDAEALRPDVRRLLEGARTSGGSGGPGSEGFEFLFLPGNHEGLRRGAGDLARLDFGSATVLDRGPFSLLRRERSGLALEILAIPHGEEYAGYGHWQVPSKQAPWRIAMAHGIVAGMAYRGPDAEGGAAALDPDLFARFETDYAALGHIHGRRHQTLAGVTMAYPGSTRVWRRHETGPRGAYLLTLPYDASRGARLPEPAFLPLASAGEYRHFALPLSLEGEPPDLERVARGFGPKDHVEIEFTGLVEDEHVVARLAETARSLLAPRVRLLDITRDKVLALQGIASQPIAREFLERWAARPERTDPNLRGDWLRARDLALAHLKACLEKTA
jgi:DNA repair exonuclease SbcCD nuclease subunit